MIQQLKLNGSDVAEVERLEEEEDELALAVLEVEGGGGAVAQARHLQEKVMWWNEKQTRMKKSQKTSFMSGARQPGQKPGNRGLLNIREWTDGISDILLL